MPATPHINFELLSEATITEDRGTRTYTATGLTIPTPDDEALVIQIGSRISYPFESLRLTSLERAAAGDEASAANGILLDEITAPNFSPDRIGLTSGDELLYAQSGQPTQVRIWHLRPDDIDISSLAAELAPRILPVPTEQTRGYYLVQSPDEETYELQEAGPPAPADVSGRLITAAAEDIAGEAGELTVTARLVDADGFAPEPGVTAGGNPISEYQRSFESDEDGLIQLRLIPNDQMSQQGLRWRLLWPAASDPIDLAVPSGSDTTLNALLGADPANREVPAGGSAGQVLTKASDEDFDDEWRGIPKELPAGGAAGQMLVREIDGEGLEGQRWQDPPTGLPAGGSAGQLLERSASGYQWAPAPVGLPAGGSAGQLLERSASGYQWAPAPVGLPAGGSAGQLLARAGAGYAWIPAPIGLPAAGSEGQFLRQGSAGAEWSALPTEIPADGSAGQLLERSASGWAWADPPIGVPAGGNDGQLLARSIDSGPPQASGLEWIPAPIGLPAAGSEGQFLRQGSAGAEWSALPTEIPAGGADGQILRRADGALAWAAAPIGLPAGGAIGQMLERLANGYRWIAPPTGLPAGGSADQFLQRTSSGYQWADAPTELPAAGDDGQLLGLSSGSPAWIDPPTGVPAGGNDGQLLARSGAAGLIWCDPPIGLPAGGDPDQMLQRTASGYSWIAIPTELPSGGSAGQHLARNAANTGLEWISPPRGLPTGWAASRHLARNAADTDFEWIEPPIGLPAGGAAGDLLERTSIGFHWQARPPELPGGGAALEHLRRNAANTGLEWAAPPEGIPAGAAPLDLLQRNAAGDGWQWIQTTTELPPGWAGGQILQRNADDSAWQWIPTPASLPGGAAEGQYLRRGESAFEWVNAADLLPQGWAAEMVLARNGDNDGFEWVSQPTGLPAGGSADQFLQRTSGGYQWADAPTELPAAGDDGQLLGLSSGSPAWIDPPISLPAGSGASLILQRNSANDGWSWIALPEGIPAGYAASQILQRNAMNDGWSWIALPEGIPAGYAASQVLRRNSANSGWEWARQPTGIPVGGLEHQPLLRTSGGHAFGALTRAGLANDQQIPALTGQAGRYAVVNADESALEFFAAPGTIQAAQPQILSPVSAAAISLGSIDSRISDTDTTDIPLASLGAGSILSDLDTDADTVSFKRGAWMALLEIDTIINTASSGNNLANRSTLAFHLAKQAGLPAGALIDPLPIYFRGGNAANSGKAVLRTMLWLPEDVSGVKFQLLGFQGTNPDRDFGYSCIPRSITIYALGGLKGDPGADAEGLPTYGSAGQILAIASGAASAEWIDALSILPAGAAANQLLRRNAANTGYEWADPPTELPSGGSAGELLRRTSAGYEWHDLILIAANQPSSGSLDQLWLDSDTNYLSVWDGTGWQAVAANIAAASLTHAMLGAGIVESDNLASAVSGLLMPSGGAANQVIRRTAAGYEWAALGRDSLAADQQIPALTGNGGKILAANAGATALELIDKPADPPAPPLRGRFSYSLYPIAAQRAISVGGGVEGSPHAFFSNATNARNAIGALIASDADAAAKAAWNGVIVEVSYIFVPGIPRTESWFYDAGVNRWFQLRQDNTTTSGSFEPAQNAPPDPGSDTEGLALTDFAIGSIIPASGEYARDYIRTWADGAMAPIALVSDLAFGGQSIAQGNHILAELSASSAPDGSGEAPQLQIDIRDSLGAAASTLHILEPDGSVHFLDVEITGSPDQINLFIEGPHQGSGSGSVTVSIRRITALVGTGSGARRAYELAERAIDLAGIGASVRANPGGASTGQLSTIEIAGVIYAISGSGGLPDGGSAGQYLAKNAANTGYAWVTPPDPGLSQSQVDARIIALIPINGGSAGQLLAKNSDNTGLEWTDPPQPGSGLPAGGSAGQLLSRTSDGYAWIDAPNPVSLPTGWAASKILQRNSANDGWSWIDLPAPGLDQAAVDGRINALIPAASRVPSGGSAGQLLAKNSDNTGLEWTDPPQPGSGLPGGGSAGQFLRRTSSGYEWADAPSGLPSGGAEGQVLERTASGYQWVDPEVLSGTARAKEWVQGRAYRTGSLAAYDDRVWRCVTVLESSQTAPPFSNHWHAVGGYAGIWQSSHIYQPGEYVKYQSDFYMALANITADADAPPSNSNWAHLAPDLEGFRGIWAAGVTYYRGQVVYQSDHFYTCTSESVTSNTGPVADVGNWDPSGIFRDSWDSNYRYEAGDQVLHDGKLWGAIATIPAGAASEPGTHANWKRIDNEAVSAWALDGDSSPIPAAKLVNAPGANIALWAQDGNSDRIPRDKLQPPTQTSDADTGRISLNWGSAYERLNLAGTQLVNGQRVGIGGTMSKQQALDLHNLANAPRQFRRRGIWASGIAYAVGDVVESGYHANRIVAICRTAHTSSESAFNEPTDTSPASADDPWETILSIPYIDWNAAVPDPFPLTESHVLPTAGFIRNKPEILAIADVDGRIKPWARIGATGLIPAGSLATGIANGRKFMRDDQVWAGIPHYRGSYADAAEYEIGDIVAQGGGIYIAIAAKASGTAFIYASWKRIDNVADSSTDFNPRGLWAAGTPYERGDYVIHGLSAFWCHTAHTPPSNAPGPNASSSSGQWRRLFEFEMHTPFDGRISFTLDATQSPVDSGARVMFNRHAWETGEGSYYEENVVRHNGARYVCLQEHSPSASNAPGTSGGAAYWEAW